MKNKIYRFFVVLLLFCSVQGYAGIEGTVSQSDNNVNTISVALYPYLPRGDQFQTVLNNAWQGLGTGYTLDFQNYDCYSADPPANLDVFVFDGIFYQYFQAQGYLSPIQISSVNDYLGFMGYAWGAVWINPTTVYGLPYLGCQNVFFYWSNDYQLDTVSGLNGLYQVIGPCQNPSSVIPPKGTGLMIDYSSGTTDACLYLNTYMQYYDSYSLNPLLPAANQLNPNVIGNLQTYTIMAGYAQASYVDTATNRIDWFNLGYGRTLVGITENLCFFQQQNLSSVKFKILPLVNSPTITQPFYVDIAGINSQISPSKLNLALLLVNLMTSYDVMYNSMIPQNSSQNPQFVIPARGKVLADLMDIHPLYIDMSTMLLNYYAQPFQIGPDSRNWLNTTKTAIKNAILSVGSVNSEGLKDIDKSEYSKFDPEVLEKIKDRGSRIGIVNPKR